MNRIVKTFACAIFTLFLTENAHSAEIEKRIFIPAMIEQPPIIDGILDDSVWESSTWETDFTQHEPHNGIPSSQRTEFSIVYDDDFIYVAIRAWDSNPDSIVSRLGRRDKSDGDYAGVAFDSYYDQRTAFVLGVTAGGNRFDHITTENGQNDDETWDPAWWARTSQFDQGWEAELKIPFSQLRFKKQGNGIWGLEVFRNIYRNGELVFWQHIPADSPGLVHMFGEMHGMENVQSRRIFDVTPYVVSIGERYPTEINNPFAPGHETGLKIGLDSKIGITNNITLDLTINPDFGQVEADPSEVNLTAFESYFEEKRPFFIEGRNISSFSLGIGDGGLGNDNLFYSRRIGRRPQGEVETDDNIFANQPAFTNIIGAAKLTGKTQRGLSVAVIQAVTEQTHAEVDANGIRSLQTIEPLTNFLVGRVQKDYNEGTTLLGGMFTGTMRKNTSDLTAKMHNQAYSGGLDFTHYFLNKTWSISANSAFSHVSGSSQAILETQQASAHYFQRPDAAHLTIDSSRTSLTGTAGKLQVLKAGSGHWNMMGVFIWKSPSFEINDLGYMREADQMAQIIWAQYREWQPKSFYMNYSINTNIYAINDFGWNSVVKGLNANGNLRFRNFWSIRWGADYNFDFYSRALLRGGPAVKMPNQQYYWLGVSSDDRNRMEANASVVINIAENQNTQRINAELEYTPTDNFSFALEPSLILSENLTQYVDQVDYNQTKRYLLGAINQRVVNFSFRINYTLTPDLTIQYWGQPFIARGSFNQFKYITNPLAEDFNSRFETLSTSQIQPQEDEYQIDENQDGIIDYSFSDPDFQVKEFLSNLVVRWEFKPGSAIYVVWSQTRNQSDYNQNIQYFNQLDQLFNQKAHNVFLAKISWRIPVTG